MKSLKMRQPQLSQPSQNRFQSLCNRLAPRSLPSRLLWSVALMLGWGALTPSLAAERLTVRLGPFEQTVAIADLEAFAETGKLPTALQPYASFLTPEIRRVLANQLKLDPYLGDQLTERLTSSPEGKRLLQTLGVAVPDVSIEQLQAALTLAARQADGLNLLQVLRAVPTETITIDVSSAIALASQFNPAYWGTQALSPALARELEVPGEPFRSNLNPATTGPQTVQQRSLTLNDSKRGRLIPVDVYWGDRTEGPLVVISHGFGSSRKFLAYLAQHLASHGFTVAALDHPGSNVTWLTRNPVGSSNLVSANEFIDRPQDISFLLDELTRLNQQSGALQGKLNTNQVTMIGHSFGGYTALAVAGAELQLDALQQPCQSRLPVAQAPADWLECAAKDLLNATQRSPIVGQSGNRLNFRDQRVVQAIALNPVVGNLFGKTGLNQMTVPTLWLTGTEDAVTPALNHQLSPFNQLQSSKYLLTAIGATHLSIADPRSLNPDQTRSPFKEVTGQTAEPLRQLLRGTTLAFVKQLTPEAKTYEPFLSPGYAQSLSTNTLALRLNPTLPERLSPWLRNLSLKTPQPTP